jgi:hypothetical protein
MGHLLGNEKFCEICGTMFVPGYNAQILCSPECRWEYMSQNFSGPDNPNWGKTFSHTEEAKAKIKKNNAQYWQGKKRPKVGKKISAKLKGRPNLALKGRNFPGRQNSGQFPEGIEPWNKGKTGVYTPEQIERIRQGVIKNTPRGPDHPHWKGGATPEINQYRASREYKEWRKAVLTRDHLECQICGRSRNKGYRIVAHHIFCFVQYPNLRFEVNNGIILCVSCHSSLHNDPNNPHRDKYIKEKP